MHCNDFECCSPALEERASRFSDTQPMAQGSDGDGLSLIVVDQRAIDIEQDDHAPDKVSAGLCTGWGRAVACSSELKEVTFWDP